MDIIEDVLDRGAYILGDDLEKFEANLAKFCKMEYAIGVGNCTEALFLSLLVSGIKPGDEVISVSHTFVATIEVIKLLGAKPVFVDIGDDYNMDISFIENLITKKTKAIIPAHLNGKICKDIDKLINLAQRNNLTVIEDAAQALGAEYRGKNAGSFGQLGCFSFYPAKSLGAFGDAGAVVTNDKNLYDKIKMLRDHGRDNTSEVKCWGFNCRMDNLHAAILDYKLKKLPQSIKRRKQIADKYYEELSKIDEISFPDYAKEDYYNVYQNYEIEVSNRDELKKFLKSQGISTILPWGGKPVHQFKALGTNDTSLPNTDKHFKKVLLLPMRPDLTDQQVLYVANKIKEFYAK